MAAMRRVALLSLLGGDLAWAADCDCQRVVGSCLGSIEFVKAYGSKPSFGADLVVHSSEKVCSKIEFLVNSTPYQTILVNKNSEPESVFGTSPISSKNIAFQSCKVCASKPGGSDPQPTGGAASGASNFDLTGRWTSNQVCSYGSGTSEFDVQHDRTTGRITGKLSNATIDSGSIEGTSIHITASHWLGNQVTMDGQVTGPNSMSGTYTQTKSAGTCTWDAVKVR
ncbi:hypothetical protein [Pseudomonas putida]|uniref:hypothetical protein n=1 Tax=Pseudomonas putida TaxID=303 RepID=UPI0039065909